MTAIRLVCFDLDGTLIDDTIFIWHTLHLHFGTPPEKRKALAEQFFKGRITYAEWAGREVDEWIARGADRKSLVSAVQGLRLMPGAKETLRALKEKGIKLAVVSGSLSFVLETAFHDYADYFAEDDILINRLVFDSEGRIIDMRFTDYDLERKADGLRHLAAKHGISLEECAFVGDHHNDVHIAMEAGLSIAFNSKSEQLDEVADHIVQEKDLTCILPLIDSHCRES
jgi:phosphoserine phosphatase